MIKFSFFTCTKNPRYIIMFTTCYLILHFVILLMSISAITAVLQLLSYFIYIMMYILLQSSLETLSFIYSNYGNYGSEAFEGHYAAFRISLGLGEHKTLAFHFSIYRSYHTSLVDKVV